ncbi:MAG TPA: outer membrane lipid asymmetry maintenance protein MlaD [Thiobacillaceae bacterium]|nr:outer membrane lipid asymmetry maintenance protein MlaD [Thiobacillaceae bacterium]HNU63226.1 outer membrane lipid asymmetry maintenance protein MlaD [Thiobacillaceae bacterium]
MQRATLDLWVGIFVVMGLGALLFLALKVGNMTGLESGQTYTVRAEFENIGGLKPRAPVKSAGVVVGRVVEIGFDNQIYEALVTMRLDARYRFPKDTSASIMTSGLLGEQYIALEAGGESSMLAEGDRLKLTQGAVVLENLIGQFLYNKAEDAESKGAEGKGAAD